MSWHERPYADGGHGGGGGGLFGGRFADNPLTWAPKIGRIARIDVRIHIMFILFIVFELLGRMQLFTLQWLTILFGSVLLHEFGHCFAARQVGGSAHEILMWPLGGLATVDAPRTVRAQFITVIWGPLVNVGLCILAATPLLLSGWELHFDSINPLLWLVPTLEASFGRLGFILATIFNLNAMLFLFNLFPMFPMDGGRMLHCALWKKLGHNRGMMITTTVGMVGAVLMGLYALTSQMYLMLAIAVLGYMACYQERQITRHRMAEGDDTFMGHDFSGGYATLEADDGPKRKGWLAGLREKRKQSSWEANRRAQQQLQDEVDAILEKVNREGINSLTRREKQTLEQATEMKRKADSRHGL